MNRIRALFLIIPFSALLFACASDGGSRGTGVTTAQGNLASIRFSDAGPSRPPSYFARIFELVTGRTASAGNGLGGVRVVAEGSDFEGVTDDNGLFAVIGSFGGPVALRFESADGRTQGRIVIDPPFGATLTLNDVRIDRGKTSVERQDVVFRGRVAATDCPNERLSTVSALRPDDGNLYTVRVGGRALRDQEGNPVACTSVAGGDELGTSGIVNPDGTIGAFDAEVQKRPSRSGGGRSGSGGGDDDRDDDDPSDDGPDDPSDDDGEPDDDPSPED